MIDITPEICYVTYDSNLEKNKIIINPLYIGLYLVIIFIKKF